MKAEEILDVMMLMPNVFEPFTMFKKKTGQELGRPYFFKGIICFYGAHYYGYFRELCASEQGDQWLLMDDATVRLLGANWADVIRHAIKAHSKPVMLIYE